jgi:hypothetical protein
MPDDESPQGPLKDHTWSVATQQQVRAWTRDCKENHTACKRAGARLSQEKSNPSIMPKRLLYVGKDDSATIKVIEARDKGLHFQYTTLR